MISKWVVLIIAIVSLAASSSLPFEMAIFRRLVRSSLPFSFFQTSTRNLSTKPYVQAIDTNDLTLSPFFDISLTSGVKKINPDISVQDIINNIRQDPSFSPQKLSGICDELVSARNFEEASKYAMAYLLEETSGFYYNDICGYDPKLASLLVNESIPENERLAMFAQYLAQSSYKKK